jgi:hypothetical protein
LRITPQALSYEIAGPLSNMSLWPDRGNEEMAEIVNLNRYRKTREKERAKAKAEENRVRHGRTKAGKLRDADERDREGRSLDGARREDDGPEPA